MRGMVTSPKITNKPTEIKPKNMFSILSKGPENIEIKINNYSNKYLAQLRILLQFYHIMLLNHLYHTIIVLLNVKAILMNIASIELKPKYKLTINPKTIINKICVNPPIKLILPNFLSTFGDKLKPAMKSKNTTPNLENVTTIIPVMM